MWRLWPIIKWIWVGVFGAVIAGIAGNLLFAPIRSEAVNFLRQAWLFLMAPVALLAVFSGWSWTSEKRRHAVELASEFDLFKLAEKLEPGDLGFKAQEAGAQQDHRFRPYNQTYLNRLAIPYELRDTRHASPQYNETGLRQELSNGRGFVLIGQPTEGKSRTLFEVVRGMHGWVVVRPFPKKSPSPSALSHLANKQVVLLMDDLNSYVAATADIAQICKTLEQEHCKWVVAAACRDGSELGAVREATSSGLRRFYEDIPLKLGLREPTPQMKVDLARDVGGPVRPEKAEAYPTLGSIVMEDAFRYMRERFNDLSGAQQDCLRAMQLLAAAGVQPFTHERLARVWLKIFRRSDALRDCLTQLAMQAFVRQPGDQDPVWPEPAYLNLRSAVPVVSYLPGEEPSHNFPLLADVFDGLKDDGALFYLGVTAAVTYHDHAAALAYFESALKIRPQFIEALFNKGFTLGQLNRSEEAIAVYDEVVKRYGDATEPALRERVAKALVNKGVTLGQINRSEEEIAVYDEVVKRYGDATEPALREQVAKALVNKGFRLGQLNRSEEEIAVYDEVVKRYGDATEPALREQVARALVGKGLVLTAAGRVDEAIMVLCRVWRTRGEFPQEAGLAVDALKALGKDPAECELQPPESPQGGA